MSDASSIIHELLPKDAGRCDFKFFFRVLVDEKKVLCVSECKIMKMSPKNVFLASF